MAHTKQTSLPWFIGAIILGVLFGLYFLRSLPTEPNSIMQNTGDFSIWDKDNNSFIVPVDVLSGDVSNDESINNSGDIQFQFIGQCDNNHQEWYKTLNVFDKPSYSPTNASLYRNYTKPYTITWKIKDAKLCIMADVVDYRKKHQYTYSTYILFSSPEYAGHINVGYSPNNRVIYDYTTSPRESFLDGRFWGNEAPKIYNINLDKLRVANPEDKGWKRIYPLKRLQKEWAIRIGGFVNAKNGEWIIKKFVIAYKCEDWSDCKIE